MSETDIRTPCPTCVSTNLEPVHVPMWGDYYLNIDYPALKCPRCQQVFYVIAFPEQRMAGFRAACQREDARR